MKTGMSRIFDNGPNRPWAGHHRIGGAGIRLHNPVAWGRQKSGALGHRAIVARTVSIPPAQGKISCNFSHNLED